MKRREFILALGGAAASLPFAARAQQKSLPVIGYFHFATPAYTPTAAAFLQGLKETGYVEGQNVAIEYRWAEGQYDRLPAMVAGLVERKVDLIAAFGPPLAPFADTFLQFVSKYLSGENIEPKVLTPRDGQLHWHHGV